MRTGTRVFCSQGSGNTATVVERPDLLGNLPKSDFVVVQWDGSQASTVVRQSDVRAPGLVFAMRSM